MVAALGAYWTLMDLHREHARLFLRMGVALGLIFTLVQLFPTGDQHGKLVARHQPAALAAMEGKFSSSDMAEVAIIGQPDVLSRGFVDSGDAAPLLDRTRQLAMEALDGADHRMEWPVINAKVKDSVAKFLYDETRRRPMVLPLAVEV